VPQGSKVTRRPCRSRHYPAGVTLADFDALSFDCYGTLIDWEAGLAAVLAPWARGHDLNVSDQALVSAYGEHEARIEAEAGHLRYPEVLARAFVALGDQLGAPVSAQDAHGLGDSVPAWPAFEDSAASLASLAERYKLIILSNVDRTSFAASNARLGVAFDLVITAEDIGSYKPSPRNFRVLLDEAAELGIQPGGLLHVAQSLFHDHVPAKAAGLSTVWIDRRHDHDGWGATPPPQAAVVPDWRFTSMAEFAAAVTSVSPRVTDPARRGRGGHT